MGFPHRVFSAIHKKLTLYISLLACSCSAVAALVSNIGLFLFLHRLPSTTVQTCTSGCSHAATQTPEEGGTLKYSRLPPSLPNLCKVLGLQDLLIPENTEQPASFVPILILELLNQYGFEPWFPVNPSYIDKEIVLSQILFSYSGKRQVLQSRAQCPAQQLKKVGLL